MDIPKILMSHDLRDEIGKRFLTEIVQVEQNILIETFL